MPLPSRHQQTIPQRAEPAFASQGLLPWRLGVTEPFLTQNSLFEPSEPFLTLLKTPYNLKIVWWFAWIPDRVDILVNLNLVPLEVCTKFSTKFSPR